MAEQITITKTKLIEHLNNIPDNALIIFGQGDLKFYRIKQRGDNLYQIEFNQTYQVDDNS